MTVSSCMILLIAHMTDIEHATYVVNEYLKIVKAMLEYQKANKITACCMTNAQYLLDCFTVNQPDLGAKAVAVLAVGGCKTVIHIAVKIGDMILDPSYEVLSLGNVKYYEKYIDYINSDDGAICKTIEAEKYVLNKFINMLSVVERMNDGKLCVNDGDYYHKQADYVEKYGKFNHKSRNVGRG